MELVVDAASARLRVDAFLAGRLPWRSRQSLVALLRGGAVHINGAPAKKARRLVPGDVVALAIPAAVVERAPEPMPPPLSVLFEDDDLVVVDKPAHLAVHAASTCMRDNLLQRLHDRDRGVPGVGPAAVVHRLDRGTTGVIAFARRPALIPFFMGQFERRTVRKTYVAIVHGEPDDVGTVELPLLAPAGASVVVDARGKPSRTTWEVIRRTAGAAMIRVALHTGRKHQIRVHMAAIGHPIVHDDLYGRVHERPAWPPECNPQLHAARLELDHTDGRRLVFEAPTPAAMLATFATFTTFDLGGVSLRRGAGTSAPIAPRTTTRLP